MKPQTIASKATGDSPLLETGDLRASITHRVDKEKKEAYVGSDNPKARYHELGTSRIPVVSQFDCGVALVFFFSDFQPRGEPFDDGLLQFIDAMEVHTLIHQSGEIVCFVVL